MPCSLMGFDKQIWYCTYIHSHIAELHQCIGIVYRLLTSDMRAVHITHPGNESAAETKKM